jgi:hypothetical protein
MFHVDAGKLIAHHGSTLKETPKVAGISVQVRVGVPPAYEGIQAMLPPPPSDIFPVILNVKFAFFECV